MAAQEFSNGQRIEEAMKKFKKTVVILLVSAASITGCKGNSEKYTYRETGIEQLKAGSYEAAITSFEQALDHSAGRVGTFELDVLKYRAEAEYNMGDYEAAAHTYEVLTKVEKVTPEYLNMQSLLYMKAGKLDEALEAYEASRTLQPETAVTEPVLLSLGQALTDAGRQDEAKVLYQKAIEAGLQSSWLYNMMGLGEMEAENYDKALEYFSLGIQAGDEKVMSRLLYNQAAVYEQKAEFSKALEILESYTGTYGSTPEIEKEIAFLKTR